MNFKLMVSLVIVALAMLVPTSLANDECRSSNTFETCRLCCAILGKNYRLKYDSSNRSYCDCY
jgi:hypothetical protein